MQRIKETWFGDRAFYKMALSIALPILAQNAITNFMNLLDNVLVGRLGTDPMNGVAIVNQLLFVFSVSIFGGVSGAGIFCAQYHGSGDHEGVRNTFRFKLLCCIVITAVALFLLLLFPDPLISAFLHEGSLTGDIEATLRYGRQYLGIMLVGLPPFALSQTYASTLRETGQTVAPMNASAIAMVADTALTFLLAYGILGLPALGVRGVALATVISRYLECAMIAWWTHAHEHVCAFASGLYNKLRVPFALAKNMFLRGAPLLANEILWSVGMTVLAQAYSLRGLAAVAAFNISTTVTNIFIIAFLSFGSTIAIIVGNLLGAGKMREARQADTRLIVFAVLTCAVLGIVMAAVAPLIPLVYNTTEEVRGIARSLIRIAAMLLPVYAFLHTAYFTLRSGGRTVLTFVFDSGFLWGLSIPVAFLISRLTDLPMVGLYAFVQSLNLIKGIIAYFLVKSDIWLHNIVSGK